MIKKNIIANYIGQFYILIIGIVMIPFYLKYLGAEAYGLVGFFALVQSWMLLLDMGISPTLAREVSKVKAHNTSENKKRFKYLLHSLEFIFILIAVTVAMSIVLFSDWITQNWLNIETLDLYMVAYCIKLIGIMVGVRFLLTLYRSGIVGSEEQVWFNQANIVIATLRFVGVLFILHFIGHDFQYFFEYQMVVSLLEFLLFSFKFYKIMDIGWFQLYFSLKAVKPVLVFASSIAYTGGVWIFITQFDKLLLSGILPLKEYGYFALLGMVANAIIQISEPISRAILPRMTRLHLQKREDEVLLIYKKSTQLVAVVVFSVAGIVGVYSYELLYAWTGNLEASSWGKDILFWYVMANGLLTLATFQYYLQFVYANLKMHVLYHSIIIYLLPPLIVWIAYTQGALGVSMAWFVFVLLSFLVWTPIIHHLLAPRLHKNWMIHDILPILFSTIVYLLIMGQFDINLEQSRTMIFLTLILIGIGLLFLNILVSSAGRTMLLSRLGIEVRIRRV